MKKSLMVFLMLLSGLVSGQNAKVLIVGDSWAQQQYSDLVHDAVFDVNGYPDIEVLRNADSDAVAIDGTTAADWVQPSELQKIINALNNNPTVDTVQLTLGGNDFLNQWHKDMTMMEEDAIKTQIVADLQTIVDAILAVDLGIEVVLSFYDYPNFVETINDPWETICEGIASDMHYPTPTELNVTAVAFGDAFATIADGSRKVFYVSHWGRMQNAYGWPNQGINPGDIQLPGDVSRTSPLEAMRLHLGFVNDCFHLSPEGYDVLVQGLYDGYFKTRFDTIFKSLFE